MYHKILGRIAVVVSVLLLTLAISVSLHAGEKAYKDLTVEQVKAKLDAKEKFTLVDVRTKEEWKEDGHIKGAFLMPVQELESHFRHLDKDAEIVVYCRSGKRSAKAAEILTTNGYKNVSNMTGGIMEWKAKGYPVK
ncbi:MAG: rhodanese-like domain-containing protein [Nitrospirota bacterium]|nr:rhodanese-like domain-containing protein [Nitrospirota bacterium]